MARKTTRKPPPPRLSVLGLAMLWGGGFVLILGTTFVVGAILG